MGSKLAILGLKQKAVLWEPTTTNVNGELRISYPVEIKCRVYYGSKRAPDALSNRLIVVASLDVDRQIKIGSIIKICTLSSLGSTHAPSYTDLLKVEEYSEIQDTKGKYSRKTVHLSAHPNTLPPVGA